MLRGSLLPLLLTAQALSAQTIVAKPVVTLGGAMANPNDELVRVTGARRLPDGRIVVAIANPIELRVYDHAGKLLNRIGRKGGGPGEFRAAVTIPFADNDSIVTYTDGYNRYGVFAPGGKLIREYEEKGKDAPPLLLHRVLLNAPGGVANGCARAVMMALPVAAPANLYQLTPDRSGHFWANVLQDRRWSIYSQAGPFLGTVTLPAGATVLDVGADFMLVHQRDADDLEQVVELQVKVPPGAVNPPCAAKRDAFALLPATEGRAAELKQVMIDAMTANEVVFSNTSYYARSADSLKLALPGGTRFGVLEGGRNGYANAVFDTRSSLTCIMRIGGGSYHWPEGVVFCGN